MRRSAFTLLLSLLAAACATAPVTAPAPPAPATTTPRETATETRPSNAMTPVASVPRTIAEPRIRVGLLSDQSAITFPRTADGYYLVSEQGPSMLRRGFTATAPLANAPVRYAVQVSAISDQSSAEALVQKIRTETGMRVDTVFDVANGQYRVLAGDFESSDAANPVRANLTERGYGRDLMVVRRPSDQQFERTIQVVDDEGNEYTIRGDLTIHPVSAETLTIDKQPYRSAARLFVNERGLFNVVNELNFEEYLYGVVPAEMGPSIFDEVEALKAQAVAARTYAFRNLGQFEREGYDICPGPACQAYKGFAAEHALSTQAVRETRGLVVTMDGKAVDTLYSATCGGETSDVSTMFPGRNDPHLKAVRCVELDMLSLAGRADSSLLTEQQVDARLFAALAGVPESGNSWSAREVTRAVHAAMRLAGHRELPQPAAASSRRGDVLTYLDTMMGLGRAARTLTLPEDRRYWFPRSENPEDIPYLVAGFLTKYGIAPTQYIDRVSLAQPMPREELYALLLSWVREHATLTNAEGKIHRLDGRRVSLKAKGEVTSFTLPEGIPIFRRLGNRLQEYRDVPVLIGDRMTIVQAPDKRPVAAIVLANYDGASLDRTSSFANWTQSYRADELVPMINRRQPIRELRGLRPLRIDESERIAEMEFLAEDGRTFTLRGLPIRWSLGVRDNIFVFEKTVDPDGVDRYTFYGKGWGHGTGMCQVGAYGAAFRGWTFDRILRHYYTGVEITPIANATR